METLRKLCKAVKEAHLHSARSGQLERTIKSTKGNIYIKEAAAVQNIKPKREYYD